MIKSHSLGDQVTVSIVSHGHCVILSNLLTQISGLESPIAHVIITHNMPSDLVINESSFFFQITVIRNKFALGFGANHNQAFKYCGTEHFCVLNPDVEFSEEPFNELINCLKDQSIGIAAPIVLDKDGVIEDSYRKFSTPLLILKKGFF